VTGNTITQFGAAITREICGFGRFSDFAAGVALRPTNMYLLAHRAISVRDALVSDGVAANRMQVVGYGEISPRDCQ